MFVHLLSRISFTLRHRGFKALVLAQAGRDDRMQSVRRLSTNPPESHAAQTTNA
jgi:hypothetical protein